MFADHPLANLLLFCGGQAAAWYYLRTGRTWIGLASTGSLWVLADWYFVAKFVFGAVGQDLVVPLTGLQVVAAGTALALLGGLWRRKWSATARRRGELFGQGITSYLRGESEVARGTFRRLVRADPWDAAAWIALGNVEARAGRWGAARRCLRRGRAVDQTGQYADYVAFRLRADARTPVADRPTVRAAEVSAR